MDSSYLVAAGLGALAALLLWRWATRRWRTTTLKARFARAQRKEAEAAQLLRRAGYEVLSSQVEREFQFHVDHEVVAVQLRADYLVSRRGRLYVAEVKSGHKAPDPADRATRRQLLEYSLAYDVDGVLLVDAESTHIYELRFPGVGKPARDHFWLGLVAGIAWASILFALYLTREP